MSQEITLKVEQSHDYYINHLGLQSFQFKYKDSLTDLILKSKGCGNFRNGRGRHLIFHGFSLLLNITNRFFHVIERV